MAGGHNDVRVWGGDLEGVDPPGVPAQRVQKLPRVRVPDLGRAVPNRRDRKLVCIGSVIKAEKCTSEVLLALLAFPTVVIASPSVLRFIVGVPKRRVNEVLLTIAQSLLSSSPVVVRDMLFAHCRLPGSPHDAIATKSICTAQPALLRNRRMRTLSGPLHLLCAAHVRALCTQPLPPPTPPGVN